MEFHETLQVYFLKYLKYKTPVNARCLVVGTVEHIYRMLFYHYFQELLRFLDKAEARLAGFGVIGADIEAVKKQIKELKDFKGDVDPMMVKVEALNRSVLYVIFYVDFLKIDENSKH